MSKSLLLTIALVSAASVTPPSGATAGVTLAVAARANATPTIASAGPFVTVVWGATPAGGNADVYVAVSRDGGGTFLAPVHVNDVPGDAALGGEQPPHVMLIPRRSEDPAIVVVWTAKSKVGTRLLVARSDNGGRSFTRAVPIAASEAAGNRGWESIAVTPDGQVVAVWLDHRDLAGTGTMHHHDGQLHETTPTLDGAQRAQLSKLYVSRIDDPATTHLVTGGVCYCCKTSVATASDGSIYAAWRHVYPGNLRDIAFTTSRDHGRTFSAPVRVSQDGWALDGCPENGPTLAVDDRHIVHVVWPTLLQGATADGEPSFALFYATTRDGRRFSARQRIPTHGTPRHPQLVARRDGSLLITWDEEVDGGRRQIAAVSAADQGATLRFTRIPIENVTRGEFPVVASAGDSALVAWTSGTAPQSAIRVVRVP